MELITISHSSFMQLHEDWRPYFRQPWGKWIQEHYGVIYWGVGEPDTYSQVRHLRRFKIIDSKKALIFQLKYA